MFDRHPGAWQRLFYGQWVIPAGPLFSYVALPWIDLISLLCTGLLIWYWSRTEDVLKRKQTLILIFGLSFAMIGASITNGLFLILHWTQVVQLGLPIAAVSCLILAFGMIRYKLFTINPATVVANIIETMDEILIVFDKNFQIQFVNSAVEKMLGIKKENLIGDNLGKLFDPQLRGYSLSQFDLSAKSGKDISLEQEFISASGEKVPVRVSLSPFLDRSGNILSIVGVASDIRKLKELLNITAERNKIKTVMDSITDGVLVLNLDRRVSDANPAALAILNLSQNMILGKSLGEFLTLAKDTRQIFIDEIIPKGMETFRNQIIKINNVKVLTISDKRFYANLISSSTKEALKAGVWAIITLHDVTEENELEYMKLDFVSIAAHELRTPLSSAKSYLSVSLKEYAKSFSADQNMLLSRVDASVKRLGALVENLLNVSKIERKAISLNLEYVNWVDNIKKVIDELKVQAESKKVELIFKEPEAKIPALKVDKLRINEVLTNLLSNAINYSYKNGQVEVSLDLGSYRGRNYLITNISDNGPGISKEALPHLFTKFFRVSRMLEAGANGTGLGLYISKSSSLYIMGLFGSTLPLLKGQFLASPCRLCKGSEKEARLFLSGQFLWEPRDRLSEPPTAQ